MPSATAGGLAGLLEILDARGGRDNLPDLAHDLTFEVDDLLPLVDAAQLLGLALVEDADIQITDDGKVFVAADILEAKTIFAQRARERAPLVRAIVTALSTTKNGNLDEQFFLDTCSVEESPRMTRPSSCASRSTGAATGSCSTSTPTAASSRSTMR